MEVFKYSVTILVLVSASNTFARPDHLHEKEIGDTKNARSDSFGKILNHRPVGFGGSFSHAVASSKSNSGTSLASANAQSKVHSIGGSDGWTQSSVNADAAAGGQGYGVANAEAKAGVSSSGYGLGNGFTNSGSGAKAHANANAIRIWSSGYGDHSLSDSSVNQYQGNAGSYQQNYGDISGIKGGSNPFLAGGSYAGTNVNAQSQGSSNAGSGNPFLGSLDTNNAGANANANANGNANADANSYSFGGSSGSAKSSASSSSGTISGVHKVYNVASAAAKSSSTSGNFFLSTVPGVTYIRPSVSKSVPYGSSTTHGHN